MSPRGRVDTPHSRGGLPRDARDKLSGYRGPPRADHQICRGFLPFLFVQTLSTYSPEILREMAAPRLFFLWPAFARATPEVYHSPARRCALAAQRMRAYHPSRRLPDSSVSDPMLDSTEAIPLRAPPTSPSLPEEKPKESILETVPDPASEKEEPHAEEEKDRTFDDHNPPLKAPHIEPPPYIHHFDTYGLVKRLTDGGWDQKQAITVMKAMRLMLADNTDLAKDALVSKSNLENEAYLFKAACAELKTEVTTRRKSEQEKMRTERNQLQHEVDILSQRLGQDTAHLKDDLKGMFDDRKLTVRNEQRDVESKVSQLNYRITVNLQADAKSEVEGLRMIMTRRVILTLGIVVGMVVGSLKLAADSQREEKPARGGGGGNTVVAAAGSAGLDGSPADLSHVKEGENPSFISLG